MSGTHDQRRDEVLRAFHAACERPSAAEIAEWAEAHPEFATDIRVDAELALQMAQTGDPTALPSEDLVARSKAITERLLRAAMSASRSVPRPAPAPKPASTRDP